MDLLVAYCRQIGVSLSQQQIEAFETYRENLYRLNEVMNLTRVPFEECETRHFVDSLLVAEFVPQGASVLDIGTGPGLPAWPLACARADLRVTAMDSSGKMLRALEAVPLENLTVRQRRAEDVDGSESFDLVTGRAVAPLVQQLEVSAAWVKVGGCVVPFRTPNERDEVEKSKPSVFGLALESIEERRLPHTDALRLFPLFRKTKPTPKRFPRTWAEIRSTPLSPPEERGRG